MRAISRTLPWFLWPWLGHEDEHICELPARNRRGQSWCSLVLAARTSILPGRRLRRAASWGCMPTPRAKLPIDAQRPVRRVFRRPDWATLAIVPRAVSSVIQEQAATFRHQVLRPEYRAQLAISPYEDLIDLLTASRFDNSQRLGQFLAERIATVCSPARAHVPNITQ